MKGIINRSDPKLDTILPWMRVVSIRNDIKDTTILRVWQLHVGAITNLKAKKGTQAAEFVTPGGILTQKGQELIKDLNVERKEYIKQAGKT